MINANSSRDVLTLAEMIADNTITLDGNHCETIKKLLAACCRNLYGSCPEIVVTLDYGIGGLVNVTIQEPSQT